MLLSQTTHPLWHSRIALPILTKEMRGRMRGARAPALLFVATALAITVVRSWYIVRESALRDHVPLKRTLRHRGGHSEIRVNLVGEYRAPERRPVPPWTCSAGQE